MTATIRPVQHNPNAKRRRWLLAPAFLLALLLALPFAQARTALGEEAGTGEPEATVTEPSVWTSKDDYVPAELVDLYGAGWQPGESVHIFVDDNEGRIWVHNADVEADEFGNFYYEFRLPGWFVATYTVTATGESGSVATWDFDDSIAQGGLGIGWNTSESGAASAEVTISAPAVSVGDVLVAQIVAAKDLLPAHTICTPSGWTKVLENGQWDGSKDIIRVITYYRVATSAADATSYTWKAKNSSGDCTNDSVFRLGTGLSGGIIRYTGVDNANPVFSSLGSSGDSSSCVAPNINAVPAESLVLRFCGAQKKQEPMNPNTNRIYVLNTAAQSEKPQERTAAAWGAIQSSVGNTGTHSGSLTGAKWASQTVVLRVAPVAITEPTQITDVSGSGTFGGFGDLYATLTDDDGPIQGKTISFELDGTGVGSAVTDSVGVAKLTGVDLAGFNADTHADAVSASFAGDADYDPSNGTGDLVVAKANQVISFAPLADKTFGDPPFDVTASGGASGNPVTFSVGASDSCTSSGTNGATITITGAGSCTVTANQTGNANYNAAALVSHTFAIAKADQVISWSDPANITYGTALGAAQLNAALTTGDGALTYIPLAGTVLDAGTHTLRVDAAETDNYNAAVKEVSITVDAVTVTVTPNSGQSKEFGEAEPTLSYTLSEDIAVSGALEREAGEDVGLYAINLGTLVSDSTNHTLVLDSTTVDFEITPATATVALSDLVKAYTGSPLGPTVTTTPTGLSYELTFTQNGDPATPIEVGVYYVVATITDPNYTGSTDGYFVIYDPDAGFVTGGGWINSPTGACRLDWCDENTVGKANFGFNAKYKKGANKPDGQTQFQFQAGNLNFHSTSYEWLVVSGARAQFKGEGTLNGQAGYGFMLTAIDGQINGGGGTDKFRMKIWLLSTGDVVYDNQMGKSDDGNDATDIGGGSIVIHSGGGPKKP